MFKGKSPTFKRNSIILLILGILMYYVFCVTVGEQISILAAYLPGETGWNPSSIVQPITMAGLVAIALTFVCNTAFMKFNAKWIIAGVTAIVGVGFILIGVSSVSVNFILFFVVLFVIRALVTFLNNGCNYLCGNWFIKNRGKALGIVTIGGPLSSATFVALATLGINGSLGFSGVYYVFGVCIIIIAIVMGFFLKNSPVDVGEHPDGDTWTDETVSTTENHGIPFSALLKRVDTWLLVLSFGLLTFGSGCVTAYFSATMIAKEVPATLYLPALVVGAVLGTPISYILGVIDDKFGTVKASLCLCGLYAICFFGIIMTNRTSIVPVAIATFGMAGVTGGAPNLTPSINYYVFGRRNYLAATRIVGTLQSVIGTFAVMFITAFVSSGHTNLGYILLIAMVAVAAIALLMLGKIHPERADQ